MNPREIIDSTDPHYCRWGDEVFLGAAEGGNEAECGADAVPGEDVSLTLLWVVGLNVSYCSEDIGWLVWPAGVVQGI